MNRDEIEGKGDQIKGKVQNAAGGVKDAVRDADRKTREI